MYLTTRGLVLRVTPYNDTDAFLTVLTADHGKLSVKARGLRRKNSPLIAPCQLLSYAEFTLFEYRESYVINEATSIELFNALRKDLQKLSLGTYFAQVAEVISQEDYSDPELLSLVLNCLHALSKTELSEDFVRAVFQMRISCIAGYMPDLSCCHICAEPDALYLDVSEGRLECASCAAGHSAGIRLPILPGTLALMRYVCSCPAKKLFSFTAGQQTLEQAAQVTETYLTTQLERSFSTLDFYKTLLNQIESF